MKPSHPRVLTGRLLSREVAETEIVEVPLEGTAQTEGRATRVLAAVLTFSLVWLVAAVAHAAPGDINTVAGTGTAGFSGDGGLATAAQLNAPSRVAVTADGGYLIADTSNNRIRKVSSAGTITTVAGTGTAGFSGDGGPATAAQLDGPLGVAATADGGFLIVDTSQQPDPQGLRRRDDHHRRRQRHRRLQRRRRPCHRGRS